MTCNLSSSSMRLRLFSMELKLKLFVRHVGTISFSTWNWRFFQCFRALKHFFFIFPFSTVSFANTKSKLLRKNKEYTSNIRITTQKTSFATVCGKAFHVCFLLRIYTECCSDFMRISAEPWLQQICL